MNLNSPEPKPEQLEQLSRARRRRARRLLAPQDVDERTAFVADLARRAYPSLEFFIFSLLSGAVIGAGYLLDSQALLIFGVLLAPLMTPWVGQALATVTGSWRFFFQTLAGFLIGSALVFVSGALAGLAARAFMPLTLNQLVIHSRLWWPDLAILAIGSVLLVVSFVRSEEKPVLPSVIVAYELYLPLSAAGFSLGSMSNVTAWLDGLMVFVLHAALATLIAIVTLAVLRFRPLTLAGYTLGTTMTIAGLLVVVGLSGLGTVLATRLAWPVPVPSFTPVPAPQTETSTPSPEPTATLTATPQPTATPTVFLSPTATATGTPSPQPTPVYARIFSSQFDGAIIRREPSFNSEIVTSLLNGYIVEVLPDISDTNGIIWVRIRTPEGIEGWMLQTLLVTATPAPNW